MQQATLFMMSTVGILDAARLPGCRAQGLVGQVVRGLGLKCWSEDSHETVKLRLRKPSNAPRGQRIGGYGSSLGF